MLLPSIQEDVAQPVEDNENPQAHDTAAQEELEQLYPPDTFPSRVSMKGKKGFTNNGRT